jgi:hypothetical protein
VAVQSNILFGDDFTSGGALPKWLRHLMTLGDFFSLDQQERQRQQASDSGHHNKNYECCYCHRFTVIASIPVMTNSIPSSINS